MTWRHAHSMRLDARDLRGFLHNNLFISESCHLGDVLYGIIIHDDVIEWKHFPPVALKWDGEALN